MSGSGVDHSRQALLVIEDDAAAREAFGLILEDSYEVLFAEDGPPALELVRTRRLDLVLLDFGLPTMDGFDVLAAIKAIAPELPVIAVTITATIGAVVRAMKLGAFDYVTKPFGVDELLAKISDAMTGAPPDRRLANAPVPEADGIEWKAPCGTEKSTSRRRCLVMVAHPGTAGTLRLALQRYVTTEVATDGIRALEALDSSIPDCVVCDEAAWAADGSAFVQVFRGWHPRLRVVLITAPEPAHHGIDRVTLVDALVPEHVGLAEVVRRTLTFCSLASVAELAEQGPGSYVFAAMEYLRLRYAEEVTVESIASAVGVSRGHLAERFRAELGLTFSQYLISLRVEVAKALLRRRSVKLDEVAALAGFHDASHLSRIFRAHTGQRPGAYRRRVSAQ